MIELATTLKDMGLDQTPLADVEVLCIIATVFVNWVSMKNKLQILNKKLDKVIDKFEVENDV